MNLLEVKNISKTYGNGETAVKALKDVSFSVPKGEYVAIVGESGSGKSTLLNMIGALDTPTSGKVLIDGKDIFAMNDRKLTVFRRRNIGFIFQAFNLIPELTVEQNIIFPLLLDYQKPDKRYLEELLTVLNLKDRRNHLPSQLSGGQQQRVAIGRALITRPSLILADEPTGNLDSQNSSEVIVLLKETSKKYEQTIIMITHNRSIAQTTDRVLQVSDGTLTDFTFPANDEEVMLTPNSVTALGVQLGDSVTLHTPAGDRTFTISGFGTDDESYYNNQTYLIGSYLTQSAFTSVMAQNGVTNNELTYYVQFESAAKAANAITELQTQYQLSDGSISENTGVMGMAGQSNNTAMQSMYGLAAILFVLVLLAGILMISGSMNSIIAQRTQFFGMLRCIGASRQQIIRFVRLEALNWCKTAVPIGVALDGGKSALYRFLTS